MHEYERWGEESLDSMFWNYQTIYLTGKENEEWEAELEGELNEFEMVNSNDDGNNDPELENQIEEMLEAEEKKQNKKWILCTALDVIHVLKWNEKIIELNNSSWNKCL